MSKSPVLIDRIGPKTCNTIWIKLSRFCQLVEKKLKGCFYKNKCNLYLQGGSEKDVYAECGDGLVDDWLSNRGLTRKGKTIFYIIDYLNILNICRNYSPL